MMIDERRSPAARAFNENARRLEVEMAKIRRRQAEDACFIVAMKVRPRSRPEVRVTEAGE